MPLPHPILRRLLVRRGFVLWVLARLLLIAVILGARALAGRGAALPSAWELLAAPQVLPFMALLAWIDLHRRREVLLIGNLGHSQGTAILVACAPAIAGELAALALFAAVAG